MLIIVKHKSLDLRGEDDMTIVYILYSVYSVLLVCLFVFFVSSFWYIFILLHLFKKNLPLAGVAQLVGASRCTPKSGGFDSWSNPFLSLKSISFFFFNLNYNGHSVGYFRCTVYICLGQLYRVIPLDKSNYPLTAYPNLPVL